MDNLFVWHSPKAENGLGEAFPYKDGAVFEDNLNEQLDSGTIVLFAQDKHEFEPFDSVEIYNKHFSKKKVMLIDNVVEQQISFNPVKYNYTIQLMSRTKLLERTILPNISITKPQGGTARPLRGVIESFIDEYSPKVLLPNNQYETCYKFQTTDAILNQACPDMQMSRPTLREAIDRVLSVIGCICYLDEDNTIRILDINKKRYELDMTRFNYKHENQSSDDYASSLDNIYNNVTPSTSINGIDNNAEFTEYVGFRDFENGVVSQDNLFIETKYPIYDIVKVCMFCYVKYRDGNNTTQTKYFKLDITDYVKEIKEFNLLDFADESGGTYQQTKNQRKISCVYYTRGDNRILNFSSNYKRVLLSNAWTINYLVAASILNHFGNTYGFNFSVTDSDVRDIRENTAFLVTYKSQIDTIRAKSGKLLPETHENNEIIDNPTEAFVDIYQQGKLFNDKVNRLGNRARIITGRFTAYGYLPKLGDYIGDYVVMNVENQYFDDFIVCKAILTENFVNINYFTGINARKRSWQIVDANEAFDKQLLKKFFFEFSFEKKSQGDNNELVKYYSNAEDLTYDPAISQRLVNYFASLTFDTSYSPSPFSVFLNTPRMQSDHSYDFIELELQKVISGNSIIYCFGMFDNFSAAGPSLVETQGSTAAFTVGQGGYIEYWNKYSSSTGEAEFINYDVFFITNNGKYTEEDVAGVTSITNMSAFDYESSPSDAFKKFQGFKPRVWWNNVDTSGQEGNYKYGFEIDECSFSTRFSNTKDSREKINFNLQFEYCTDTKDIIFTTEFIKRKAAISSNVYTSSDYIIYTSAYKYEYGETKIKSGSTPIENCMIGFGPSNNNPGCIEVSLSKLIAGAYESIAVGTTDGKLVLAINTTKHLGPTVPYCYLNLLQTRDRKEYFYSDNGAGRRKDISMLDWKTDTKYQEVTLQSIISTPVIGGLIAWFTTSNKSYAFSSSRYSTYNYSVTSNSFECFCYDSSGYELGFTITTSLNEVDIVYRSSSDNEAHGYTVLCANGYYIYKENGTIKFAKPKDVLDENGKVKDSKYFCDMRIFEVNNDNVVRYYKKAE